MASDHSSVDVFFSVVMIIGVGTFFFFNLARLKLPYTFIMFACGIIMGLIGGAMKQNEYNDIFDGLEDVSPHLVLNIFLPILLFEGAYAMKIHAFWSIFSFVVLLAGPGLLINTALLGGVLLLMFPSWSIFTAGLLGSILSSTDPVAVMALLKELGVDKRMTAMVDGEALINDGSSIILYLILLPAAVSGEIADPWHVIVLQCFRFIGVGVVFGLVMGFIMHRTLIFSRGNEFVQTFITIVGAYTTFYVADVVIETSGVLSIVFCGLYLATFMPTLFPGKEHSTLNHTWHFLVHIANTALFALVGVVIARHVFPYLLPIHLARIILMYLACTAARFLMVMALKPCFYFNKNYDLGMKEAALLVHGGLRGGVSVMLALIVYETNGVDKEVKTEILILTAGIVILTMAVNSTTSKLVVTLLGHRSKDQNRLLQMEMGVRRLKEAAKHAVEQGKLDPTFAGTNWDEVQKLLSKIENPYEGAAAVKETDDRMFHVLLMRAFKTKIWHLRDSGALSESGIVILGEAVAHCIRRGTLITSQDVTKLMQFPLALRLLSWLFLPNIVNSSGKWGIPFLSSSASAASTTRKVFFSTATDAASSTRGSTAEGGSTSGYDPEDDYTYNAEEEAKITSSKRNGCAAFIAHLVLKWRLRVEGRFYGCFIGYSEALDQLAAIYAEYALNPQQAEEARRWLEKEKEVALRKIRAYAARRPKTVCSFKTRIATGHVLHEVSEAAERLHSEMGFAVPATEALLHTCNDIFLNLINKWPTQIDLLSKTELLHRSAIFKKYPAADIPKLEQAMTEHTYRKGEIIQMGHSAGVVVSGVLSSFGTAERHRGPGDCFNVAPALCRTTAPEFIVTSKHATVLAIPYSVLQESSQKHVGLLESLVVITVGETLASVVKDTLVGCGGQTVDHMYHILREFGRCIRADRDGFVFSAKGEVADVTRVEPLTACVRVSDGEGKNEPLLSSEITTVPLTSASRSSPQNHPISILPCELLKNITDPCREHLLFVSGSSYAPMSGVTNAIGPVLLPVSVATRLRFKKESMLYAASPGEFFAPGGQHSAANASNGSFSTPSPYTTSRSSGGLSNASFGGTINSSTLEMSSVASQYRLRTASVLSTYGQQRRLRNRVANDDPEAIGVGGITRSRVYGSDNALDEYERHNDDDRELGEGDEDAAETMPFISGNDRSQLAQCEASLTAIAALLAKFDPETAISPIPYFAKHQLRFMVELEQLMAAIKRLLSDQFNADERVLVAAITERVLSFLQKFCLESFSAERVVYSRLTKSLAATATTEENKSITDASTNAASASDSAVVTVPLTSGDDAPPCAASMFEVKTVTLRQIEARIAHNETERNAFAESVATWRERLDSYDISCTDEVMKGMARFATEHFPADSALGRVAVQMFPRMASACFRAALRDNLDK